MKTFREMYCERQGLAVARFEDELVARAWYPHARPVRWLAKLAYPAYLEPDREFVRSIGDMRSRRLFGNEAADFHHHRDNRKFLRRVLKMRVSAERLRRIFDAVMTLKDSRSPVS